MIYDGRITDGQCHTFRFSNTIIIMTSNLRAEQLLVALSDHTIMKTTREKTMKEVRRHFMLEILNTHDAIVVFNPLSHDELRNVSRI